jgi:hypothetical protein
MMFLNSSDISKGQKTAARNCHLLCNGFWINLVLRAKIQTHQGLNQRQKTAVCDCNPTCAAVFWIHTQAVIIKLMTTSHFIGGNFASDVPKDFEADTDDKIVIDKLLVNKLTELLINSIYSVHTSRRSEIFLTSLDMHLADFSISNKNDIQFVVNLLKNHHYC